jgi:anaerobic magnesium-protoporphyrin IX monomethyl ester cyclase
MGASSQSGEFNIVLLEWRPFGTFYELSLGLQYIAAVLKRAEYGVHTFIFEEESIQSACEKIFHLQPDVVGIALYRENPDQPFAIARQLKAVMPEVTVIAGGHTATLYAARILYEEPAVDLVVCGEGELTVVEVCDRLRRGQSLAGCKGIYYRLNGTVHRGPPRELVGELDALPMPDLDVMFDIIDRDSPVAFANISTARGCLGKCNFCVENRFYRGPDKPQWRGRSPLSIITEIENLYQLFPGRRLVVRFVDSSFEDPEPKTKVRLREIVKLIETYGLRIAFSFYTRAESWTEEDDSLIQQMRECGLFEVQVGFESGTPRSLKLFNKRATVEDNLHAVKLFAQKGVHVYGYLIMFHPYVAFDELEMNAHFLKRVGMAHLPVVWYHHLIMYPDTRIFRRVVADGLLLGPEASGYAYTYAFEDGRISKVHRALQLVKDLKSTDRYEDTTTKVNLELSLYEIWQCHFEEMRFVSTDMSTHRREVEQVYDHVAAKQHELFLELLNATKREKLEDLQDCVIDEWDRTLSEGHRQLEAAWMRCRMQLGRKGIRLI